MQNSNFSGKVFEKFMRCFHDGSLRGGRGAPGRAADGDQLMQEQGKRVLEVGNGPDGTRPDGSRHPGHRPIPRVMPQLFKACILRDTCTRKWYQ